MATQEITRVTATANCPVCKHEISVEFIIRWWSVIDQDSFPPLLPCPACDVELRRWIEEWNDQGSVVLFALRLYRSSD